MQDSCRGLPAWLEVSFPSGAPGSKGWTRRGWVFAYSVSREYLSVPCAWVLPNPRAVAHVIRKKAKMVMNLQLQLLPDAQSSSQRSCPLPATACASRHSLHRFDLLISLENTQIWALVPRLAPWGVPAQAAPLLQEQRGRRQQFCRMQLQQVESSTGALQSSYSK